MQSCVQFHGEREMVGTKLIIEWAFTTGEMGYVRALYGFFKGAAWESKEVYLLLLST